MPRFSLRTLGAVVAAIAVSCAALMKANGWVGGAAWTLVFVILTLATIAALLSAANRRGFWTGFAVAGWLYVLVGIGPWAGYPQGLVLSTALLERAAKALEPSTLTGQAAAVVSDGEWVVDLAGLTTQPVLARSYRWQNLGLLNQAQGAQSEFVQSFIHVGQAICTLLFALLAGWFGWSLVARRDRGVAEKG